MNNKITYTLVIISLLLAILITFIIWELFGEYEFVDYIQAIFWWVSAFWIYNWLLLLVDNILWKESWFRYLFWIDRVSLAWEREWKWVSSYKEEWSTTGKEFDVTLTIKQTLTTILITWRFNKSMSYSIIGEVKQDVQRCELLYLYWNTPLSWRDDWMSIHSWYCSMMYFNDVNWEKLEGNYSTSTEMKNHWTINVTRRIE